MSATTVSTTGGLMDDAARKIAGSAITLVDPKEVH